VKLFYCHRTRPPLQKHPHKQRPYLFNKIKKVIKMSVIDRKDLCFFQTSILVRMKENILKRVNAEPLTKDHSKLLIDILGELDSRDLDFN